MNPLTSAVAAVIEDPAGRVLLCQQSQGHRRWVLPGGKIRLGESPVHAAIRDIQEEAGSAIEIIDLVGLYQLTGDGCGDDLPVTAIVREVRRETGMETRIVDLLGLYHLTGALDGDDEELPDVLTYAFRCEALSGEPVLNARGRIRDLGWYSPLALPALVTATAQAAVADCGAGRSGVVRELSRSRAAAVA